jgi:ribosomal protein S17E
MDSIGSDRKSISSQEFFSLFDFTISKELTNQVEALVADRNFEYEVLLAERRDAIILEVLKKTEVLFSPSGKHRESEWNVGWGENLAEFIQTGYAPEALVPKYYRPSHVKRWNGNYILAESSNLEYEFFEVLRHLIFQKFLENTTAVFEFGCGSPHNLLALAQQFPGLEIHGCDWSLSAVQIVNLLSEKNSINAKGELFDFFNPNFELNVPLGSAFLTIGGLEQVGENHGEFLKFIMEKKPAICIHLEPIYELYDENDESLFDYLAKRYHKSRNYLSGYLTRIIQLESEGKASIEAIKRVPFGGQFHEGWSLLVWRPL